MSSEMSTAPWSGDVASARVESSVEEADSRSNRTRLNLDTLGIGRLTVASPFCRTRKPNRLRDVR
jgi:hypothetical protein